MVPDVVIWTAGILTAVVVAAALVYIVGFIASMLVAIGYGLFEGVEHAAHRVHRPHVHVPTWSQLRETLAAAWQHSRSWPSRHLHRPGTHRVPR